MSPVEEPAVVIGNSDDDVDPRLYRLRVELFTAAQVLKGKNREYLVELIRDVASIL